MPEVARGEIFLAHCIHCCPDIFFFILPSQRPWFVYNMCVYICIYIYIYIYIYIIIIIIRNLSNDRSKASSKSIPPHSDI